MKKQNLVVCKSCGRKFFLLGEDNSRCAVCNDYTCRKCMSYRLCPEHFKNLSLKTIMTLNPLEHRQQTLNIITIVMVLGSGLVITLLLFVFNGKKWLIIPTILLGNLFLIPIHKINARNSRKKTKKITQAQNSSESSNSKLKAPLSLDKQLWDEVESMKSALVKSLHQLHPKSK